MPDHTHPEYDQALTRITGILERLTDNQVFIQGALGRTTTALDRLVERAAETEDKLNALINLMDQHLRDHREGRA